MSAPGPNTALMPALGRMMRGLSALFWGLPLTLLVCTNNIVADWLRTFGVVAPVALTVVLYYGVRQFGCFQPQERIWIQAVERVKILAIVNIGLAPFVYWWNRVPDERLFVAAVGLFFASGLVFLHNLNLALERLTAMLPDETLRSETRLFTRLNRGLLLGVLIFVVVLFGLSRITSLPDIVLGVLQQIAQLREWLVTAAILPPVAMTMTLIWKIKDAIFSSVFDKPV
ncbi:MAG TPA: hypothetical protein VI454_02355 [Verrucomicrobiae bacterium]|jgi:hypothetical protein